MPQAASYPFLDPPLTPGDIGSLDGYRIISRLGEGGMGIVFKGQDKEQLHTVAIKVMRPELAERSNSKERFLRECRAATAIKSEYIAAVYAAGNSNGVLYLVMEHLAGRPLEHWVKDQPEYSRLYFTLRLARDILQGLAALHDEGMVHRDIKPANIWFDPVANRFKLLDFGLVQLSDESVSLTIDGLILGTPAYMAPEQIQNTTVDGRADLFGIGAVLYWLLAGSNPFDQGNRFATLYAIAQTHPPPLNGVPDSISDYVTRLLNKAPEDRPQSASAARDELLEIVRQLKESVPQAGATSQPMSTIPSPRISSDTSNHRWEDTRRPGRTQTSGNNITAPLVPNTDQFAFDDNTTLISHRSTQKYVKPRRVRPSGVKLYLYSGTAIAVIMALCGYIAYKTTTHTAVPNPQVAMADSPGPAVGPPVPATTDQNTTTPATGPPTVPVAVTVPTRSAINTPTTSGTANPAPRPVTVPATIPTPPTKTNPPMTTTTSALSDYGLRPTIAVETSMGSFKVELDSEKAPISVKNFLSYVEDKHYDGTVFHRVIPTFMIQGGGFEPGMEQKKTKAPIKNESTNGLSNDRGTIAMARTGDPDSATAQFFINVKDNANLDGAVGRPGYAVFGKVTDGMDVVDKIKAVETGTVGPFGDVPKEDVVIKSIKVVDPK